jgi:arylsulfatase
VIFLTDNGGTVCTKIFNAGMRGGKNTPYQGATRVPSFWRWPAGFKGGVGCGALTAHIDMFPTLAEIAGVKLSRDVARQVDGRSLLSLLKNPEATWPERTLVTHIGRWPRGGATAAKYSNCSIQNSRYSLVNNRELYDLKADPGEMANVIEDYPAMVTELRAAYDRWWNEVQPLLVNEDAIGPEINPFKALYWKQFGGGPDAALLKAMDPSGSTLGK